jgi:hypothetical protein
MDETGTMRSDFVLDANLKLDIVGETIKIIAKEEQAAEKEIKVTAKAAIDIAIQGNYLESALSVKLVSRNGKNVWRVVGTKNLEITNVYVDVVTGAVVETE